MAGFQRQSGAEGFQRPRRFIQMQKTKPAIDMKITINAGEAARDDIFISAACADHITCFEQGISQVEMGESEARIGLDRGVECLKGRRLVAGCTTRIAKIIQHFRIGRREAGSAFQDLTRWRHLTTRKKRQAKQPVGLHMLWFVVQEGAIARNGRVQIAGLMLAERGLQIGRGQGDSFRAETARLSLPGKTPTRPAGRGKPMLRTTTSAPPAPQSARNPARLCRRRAFPAQAGASRP